MDNFSKRSEVQDDKKNEATSPTPDIGEHDVMYEAATKTKKKQNATDNKQNEPEPQEEDEKDKVEKGSSDQASARRQTVAAKSQKLIAEMSERDHTDLNAMEAVQLIVAERVSWLGSWLFGSQSPEETELHVIEQQFDLLGTLADKLADPETEVSPEVENIYTEIEEIIESDADTCSDLEVVRVHAEGPSDKLLEVLAHRFTHDHDLVTSGLEAKDLVCDEHEAGEHDAAIAFIVTSLALACRHHRIHGRGVAGGSTVDVIAIARPESTTNPEISTSEASTLDTPVISPVVSWSAAPAPRERPLTVPARSGMGIVAGATALAVLNHSRQSGHRNEGVATPAISRPEWSTPEAAVAPIDTTPVAVTPSPSPSPRRVTTPSHVISSATSVTSRSFIQPEQAVRSTPAGTAPSPEVAFSRSPEIATLTNHEPERAEHRSTKRIEDWSLDDLLHAAETIPLGHGRYLKKAYEHGEIDRQGLVKVIKEWSAGRSHLPSFASEKKRFALSTQDILRPAEVSSPTAVSDAREDISLPATLMDDLSIASALHAVPEHAAKPESQTQSSPLRGDTPLEAVSKVPLRATIGILVFGIVVFVYLYFIR